LPPWRSTSAPASSRERRANAPVKTNVFPAKRASSAPGASLSFQSFVLEALDQFLICGSEKISDALRDFGATFGTSMSSFDVASASLGATRNDG